VNICTTARQDRQNRKKNIIIVGGDGTLLNFLKTAAKLKKYVIYTAEPKGRELNFSHQPRARHELNRSSSAAGPRRHSRAPTTASPRLYIPSSNNLIE